MFVQLKYCKTNFVLGCIINILLLFTTAENLTKVITILENLFTSVDSEPIYVNVDYIMYIH